MPNHFETYKFRFRSEEETAQGRIVIHAGFAENNLWDSDGTTIYYAANKDKIVFSEKSENDAKSKLR